MTLSSSEHVLPKERKAKAMRVPLSEVFDTLQIYLGSLYVNDFNLFGHTFRVTLQADKEARASSSDLSRLYVRNATGGMVPLAPWVRWTRSWARRP